MSNIIFGNVSNGVCTAVNTAATEALLAADKGSTWTVTGIQLGWCYVAPHCATSPFILRAQSADGRSVTYELQCDIATGDLYRTPAQSGAAMGSGMTSTCGGCSDCIEEFDSSLRTTGCDCIGSGTCSLSGGAIA